jgi:hypothetical protein
MKSFVKRRYSINTTNILVLTSIILFVGAAGVTITYILMSSGMKNNKHSCMNSDNPEGGTCSCMKKCNCGNKSNNETIQIISYPQGNGTVWPPDLLANKYAQPVRDTSYTNISLPVGVHTNIGYVTTSYRQVGILVPKEHSEKSKMLILMGRPLYVNRNKWQYYAITDQRNEVKLTVRIKGKAATNEYGVDEVSTSDKVHVQGYAIMYTVDLYENAYETYV